MSLHSIWKKMGFLIFLLFAYMSTYNHHKHLHDRTAWSAQGVAGKPPGGPGGPEALGEPFFMGHGSVCTCRLIETINSKSLSFFFF